MSKARIVAHEGKGLYTVDIEIDATYLEQLQQQANAEYTRILFKELPDAQLNESTQASILADAQAAVDLAIFNYQTTPTKANFDLIDDAAKEAIKKSAGYRNAKQVLDSVNSRLNALRKKLEILRDHDQTTKRSALWCVDLADGKKDRKLFYPGDEVGTIEISGQDSIGQTLQPSFVHGWEYSLTRDGFLESVHGLTPFEYLYNWTLLPSWQTWRHRYRSGEIVDGNPTDGWTVRLDNTKSITSNIEVNNIASDRILTGIHAQYMSCNDLAFGLKDHVVLDVAISGPSNATVISAIIVGFVEKPKPCLNSGFGYYALEADGSPSEWQHINDETGAWVKLPSYANDLTAHAFDVSGEPTVRSWIGDDIDSDAPVLEFIENGSAIYQSGIKLADIPTSQSYRILGAALSPKRKYLWAIFTYSTASNKLWLSRFGLDIDPSLKDDTTGGDHTVILSATLKAKSSFNGQVVIDSDALLSGSLTAKAIVSGVLSVTPGWEMQEFDLGANAPTGHIGGKFSFNASCTRAIGMWDFIHGAKRTPQVSPGGGAAWSASTILYDDYWKEKLEITINGPDAKTLAKADASITNHGRQGYLTKSYIGITTVTFSPAVEGPIVHDVINGLFLRDYTYPCSAHIDETIDILGDYQTDAGFIGDEEISASYVGSGSDIRISDSTSIANYNDTDVEVTYVYARSGGTEINFRVPSLGITVPFQTTEYNVNINGAASGSSSNQAQTISEKFVAGTTSSDLDSLTVIHNETRRELFSNYFCENGSTSFSSSDKKQEFGSLWCGAPIDTNSGDITEVLDSGTLAGDCVSVSPWDAVAFHDTYSDSGPAPPLQEPENPFIGGEYGLGPFVSEANNYFLDITGWHGDDSFFASIQPANPYEKVQGARAVGRKHMAYWQNTRTPGGVREYKAYLTGGDPLTLDGLTGDVIYRAIHPT